MGFKDADWAYTLDLPATPKAVLVALCHRTSDKTHSTIVGQQAVAEMLGITSRAVIKAMADLEARGAIRRERRYVEGGFRTSDKTVIQRDYVNDVRVTHVNEVQVNDVHVNEDHVNLTTGSGERGSGQRELRSLGHSEGHSATSSEAAIAPVRDDVTRILDILDDEIVRNGSKRPSRTKANIDAARLLIDKDGRTVDQIERAIRWCQADTFWRSNILSMVKLREKYDQLRLAAQRQQGSAQQSAPAMSKAARNAAEYQRIFGGDHEYAGSVPALDAGIGS